MTWDHVKAAVKASEDLDVHAAMVLIDLARLADGKGVSFPGQDFLARRPGLGRTTVKRAVETLVELRLVSVVRGDRQTGQKWASNVYTVHLASAASPQSRRGHGGGKAAVASRPRRTDHRRPEAATAPQPSGGHNIESTLRGVNAAKTDCGREGDVARNGSDLQEPANDGTGLVLIQGGRAA